MDWSFTTKYQRDVLSSNKCSSLLKALHDKPFSLWENEHNERLMLAALLMIEMGMGKRICEFHNADLRSISKNTDDRVKTYADYLSSSKKDITLVSRQLNPGFYDGINVIKSEDYYGGLSFYLTNSDIKNLDFHEKRSPKEKLSYRYMDTLIFDNFTEYLEYYIRTAVASGKDCFIPVIGYKDSDASQIEIEKQSKLKEVMSTCTNTIIQEVETNGNKQSFVKILKISKN